MLSLDLGNHFIKWWLCRDLLIDSKGCVVAKFCETELKNLDWNEIKEVRIASVKDRTFTEATINLIKILCKSNCVVREAFPQANHQGLHLKFTDPNQIGVDRYLAMLAAVKSNGLKCIIDVGSALTVDIVDESGIHRGGYIIPGLFLSRKVLVEQTSKIKLVSSPLYSTSLGPAFNTMGAVEHGIRRSVLEFVKAIYYEQMSKDKLVTVRLILSGGDHEWLIPHLRGSVVSKPNIVKDGLDTYFNLLNVF